MITIPHLRFCRHVWTQCKYLICKHNIVCSSEADASHLRLIKLQIRIEIIRNRVWLEETFADVSSIALSTETRENIETRWSWWNSRGVSRSHICAGNVAKGGEYRRDRPGSIPRRSYAMYFMDPRRHFAASFFNIHLPVESSWRLFRKPSFMARFLQNFTLHHVLNKSSYIQYIQQYVAIIITIINFNFTYNII